jgi:Zn-finger nucleic acid-binding protein
MLKCPIDGTELLTRVYEADIHVDGCETCSGIWLDHGELERIQATIENDYSEELRRTPDFVSSSYELANSRNEEDRDCPKCGAEMVKREYAYSSNVRIDVCAPCLGTWLDGGEMKKIEIFFERTRSVIRHDENVEAVFFASLLTGCSMTATDGSDRLRLLLSKK